MYWTHGWYIAQDRKTDGLHTFVFNGHKRAHALTFQAVITPDGIIMHIYGPVENRRYDWTLYVRSEFDKQLESALIVEDKQHCIYRDCGYNEKDFVPVPFQESEVSDDQHA